MKNLIALSVTLLLILPLHSAAANDSEQQAGEFKGAFISQVFPSNVSPGETFKGVVQFRNVGGIAWQGAAKELYLNLIVEKHNARWKLDPIALDTQSNIPPNATATFTFSLSAPKTEGSYTLRWELTRLNEGTISDTSPENIIHVGEQLVEKLNDLKHNAEFIAAYVASPMRTGEEQDVILQFKNTGRTTWTSEAVALTATSQNDKLLWFIDQAPYTLGDATAPGEVYTFRFSVRAPAEAGQYPFQWQMYDLKSQRPFGAVSDEVKINVLAQ